MDYKITLSYHKSCTCILSLTLKECLDNHSLVHFLTTATNISSSLAYSRKWSFPSAKLPDRLKVQSLMWLVRVGLFLKVFRQCGQTSLVGAQCTLCKWRLILDLSFIVLAQILQMNTAPELERLHRMYWSTFIGSTSQPSLPVKVIIAKSHKSYCVFYKNSIVYMIHFAQEQLSLQGWAVL